jgi:hypothetical protein
MIDGADRWRLVADMLVVALRGHRADMHQASSRPCETCRNSAMAIRAYDEALDDDRRAEAQASRYTDDWPLST